ncbi:MAG TPA: hypothetical protein VFM02_00110 [Candidatus Paceibacterota bacterium]|nr:hypothetical protein [Candidatus Paceibacterota bacterium]
MNSTEQKISLVSSIALVLAITAFVLAIVAFNKSERLERVLKKEAPGAYQNLHASDTGAFGASQTKSESLDAVVQEIGTLGE